MITYLHNLSVIFSAENNIYFCGKKIGVDEFDAKPFQVSEFQSIFKENENIQIKDVQTGAAHVVVLTGKIFQILLKIPIYFFYETFYF